MIVSSSTPSLGLDPITLVTAGAKILDFLGNEFGGGGPSAEQLRAQQEAAAAAQRKQVYLGIGMVGGAAVLAAVLMRS